MHVQGNSFQSIEIVNTKFDMDLLEKVRHLIEEEKYSTLAKLGKCALMSTESQLFEDVIATSQWRRQGGAGGGAVASPMLKKMVLVILPNSMRKLGGGMRIHLRCEKIINTKYF